MELPQIGKNCQLDNCNSLDFLPVSCPLCNQTYCGDHRLPLDHKCSQWSSVDIQLIQCDTCQHLIKGPESTPEASLAKHKGSNCQIYLYPPTSMQKINRVCAAGNCKDIDPRVGPVHCNGCQQDFCLRHRHPSSHQCISLNNDEQRKIDRKLAAQEKLAKTFTTPAKIRKLKPVAVKGKNGGMVELMKMKQQAKSSDANIPTANRLYLYLQCPREANAEYLPVYFDKKSSVGRVLDAVAGLCKVSNQNHTLNASDPQRLELYKCPEMTVLDKSSSLEKQLKNLDTVLLERQGAMVFDDDE